MIGKPLRLTDGEVAARFALYDQIIKADPIISHAISDRAHMITIPEMDHAQILTWILIWRAAYAREREAETFPDIGGEA